MSPMASYRAPTTNLNTILKSSLSQCQSPFRLNFRSVELTRGFSSLRLKSSPCGKVNLRWTSSSMAGYGVAKSKGQIKVFETEDDMAVAIAKYTADLCQKLCQERGSFTVVLSGGSLVKSLRKLLVPPLFDWIDWSRWHVFWVDERVVPKDHPDSNYLLAYNEFLSKVPIPAGNVYAINDALSAEDAADDYETGIRQLMENNVTHPSKTGFPIFDLILLGMGPDGHIASLFPGHPLLLETKKWVSSINDSPKPPPERISFTLPVINSAANVALVVAGSGKASAVYSALGGSPDSDVLPVQLVAPEGELIWFLDKGAASKL